MRATNPLGRSARGGTNLPNSASPQHNRKPFYTAQLEVVQPPNSANPPEAAQQLSVWSSGWA